MSSSTKPAQKQNFYIHIGAPAPIIWRLRSGGVGGTLFSFNSSLTLSYRLPTGLVTLGVGSGITLSVDESIANARATAQLTVAQSRAFPLNAPVPYEIQHITSSGREEVISMGKLIPQGGDNPDV